MFGQERRREERAVSPVIGVILMVAITVILAAVIGTFVLNLGGSVSQNVQAGASVTTDSGKLTVTFSSNQNADYLTADVTTSGSSCTFPATSLSNVGDSMTTANSCTANSVHVIVTAHTDSGQSTVIIDKDVEV